MAQRIKKRSEEVAKTLELNQSISEEHGHMKVKPFLMEPRKIYNRDERDRIQRMISGNAKAYETSHAHMYGREPPPAVRAQDSSESKSRLRKRGTTTYSRPGTLMSRGTNETSPLPPAPVEKSATDEQVPFEIVRPLYGTYLEPSKVGSPPTKQGVSAFLEKK